MCSHLLGIVPQSTDIHIRWGDTDAGGLIYYPRFFHFVVVGLNDYFAPAGDDGHLMDTLRREGFVLPAVEASASFHSPLRAGDTAQIETTVTNSGDTSLTVSFTVTRADDEATAATGKVTFVLVDQDFKPTPLPEEIRQCVRARGDSTAL